MHPVNFPGAVEVKKPANIKIIFLILITCASAALSYPIAVQFDKELKAVFSHSSASKQRLFLVGYSGVDTEGNTIAGTDGISVTGGFPSLNELEKNLLDFGRFSTVYITSLYEFKSKTEYDLFWAGWKSRTAKSKK